MELARVSSGSLELASKIAALTLASRTSARTFSTFTPLYASKYSYTPTDSFSTSSATEIPAVSSKPKSKAKKAVHASLPKTVIQADNASNPLILRYATGRGATGSKPLTYFLHTKFGRTVKRSKRVDSISEKWAEMGKDQRQRYFEVFELARLENEERAKREPEMAAEAQARARKITLAINVEGRPKDRFYSPWKSFVAEQFPLSQGTTGDKMKAISEKWWNLSPAEKKPYEAKSEKDQATYKTNIDAWKSDRIKKEGRPKKPPGSFQIFVKEQLPSTQADNPNDRMKVIAEKWANLSPAEKKPYEVDSEKAKAAYKIEWDAWKRN